LRPAFCVRPQANLVKVAASGFAASRMFAVHSLAAHYLRQTNRGRRTVREFGKLNEFENL
jgi:hypothetical protein